jgi:hypothetical protein
VRERDWIRLSSIDVSVSCYCPIGLNGEMLHHIATRNKNQKQSFSAAPSSLVDVSENVFLMRIEIDKNTGSDIFPPAAFQILCIYLFFIPPTLCSILSRLWGRGTQPKSFQFNSSVMERGGGETFSSLLLCHHGTDGNKSNRLSLR